MIGLCLSLIPVSFIISLLLTCLLIRFARPLGLLDQPGKEGHKGHRVVVPNIGGIAIFWSVVGPILAVLLTIWFIPMSYRHDLFPPVTEHIAGLRRVSPQVLGLVIALAVVHVLGLIDDRHSLGPKLKLLVQLLVAAGLAIWCDMRVLWMLGEGESGWYTAGYVISIALSITWLVVITNAFNFLDNMDGLSGGVAAIITAVYLASTLIGGQWFIAATAAMLLGGLIGFLCFNFPPARIFMGDGGSLVVGLLAAVIAVQTTYYHTDVPVPGRYWYGLLMPLLVMAIPLYDFTSVTLIRLLRGRSPFVGDHNHFSHRLVRKGLTRGRAVVVIWLCTAATAMGGIVLGSLQSWQAIIVAAQAAAVMVILALLERDTHRNDKAQ